MFAVGTHPQTFKSNLFPPLVVLDHHQHQQQQQVVSHPDMFRLY
jgi:hypothetical protein